MNRAAQQRPLNHPALLERGRQRRAAEVAHARPEADISRWRVLRLQSADALDRLDQWQRRALEQELAREQRAIELACGQDALGSFRLAAGRGNRSSAARDRDSGLDFDDALGFHEAMPPLEQVVAGTQLVLAPASGGLDPEELLARRFRYRSHGPSLRNQLPRLFGVFVVTGA